MSYRNYQSDYSPPPPSTSSYPASTPPKTFSAHFQDNISSLPPLRSPSMNPPAPSVVSSHNASSSLKMNETLKMVSDFISDMQPYMQTLQDKISNCEAEVQQLREELPSAEVKLYKDTYEKHFEELMVRTSNIERTMKQQIEDLKREVEEKHAHQVALLNQQIHQLQEQNSLLWSERERERRQLREHTRAVKDKCGGEQEKIEVGDTVLLYDSVAGCFREKKSGRGYTPYKVTQICAPNRFMLFNGKKEISVTRGEIKRSNGAYPKDVLDPG